MSWITPQFLREITTDPNSENYHPDGQTRDIARELLRHISLLTAIKAVASGWANQPNDYDEDTQQQITDGEVILGLLDLNNYADEVRREIQEGEPSTAREYDRDNPVVPARVITDPAELETLPGRTIVVGKSNVGYQLTSWDGFTKAANWASPYDYGNRATSHEVIEKEGSVSVVFEPTEEVRRNV